MSHGCVGAGEFQPATVVLADCLADCLADAEAPAVAAARRRLACSRIDGHLDGLFDELLR